MTRVSFIPLSLAGLCALCYIFHGIQSRYFSHVESEPDGEEFLSKTTSADFQHHNLTTTKAAFGRKEKLLILFWTPLFGSYEIWFKYFAEEFRRPCGQDCLLTDKKSAIKRAHLVIFSGYKDDHTAPPKFRRENQIWAFFSQESPQLYFRNKTDYDQWNGVFNWTLTYRRDSDVPILYGEVIQRNKTLMTSNGSIFPTHGYFFGSLASQVLPQKTSQVAAVISHCPVPSQRMMYINRLRQEGIEVDIYGKCGTHQCPPDAVRNPKTCFEALGNKYKFVLAFENSYCDDYATEKLFEALRHPWIPIVRGGANYSAIVPEMSVIDASYMSPRELATRIRTISADDSLYLKYFEWKRSMESVRSPSWGCLACDKLKAVRKGFPLEVKPQAYENLHDWWVVKSHCSIPAT